jgi:spore germination protein GerM
VKAASRLRALPLSLLALAVVLTGCGVPSAGPEPIPTDVVLAEPGGITDTPPETGATVGVALVRGDRFVVVDRVVAALGREDRINAALDLLLASPDDRETRRGLTTAIPPDAAASAGLSGQRAVVDVDFGPAPINSTLAAGQIALTALSVPGVQSVVFTVDGVATDVPLPNGKDSNGPVTKDDYEPR